MTNPSGRRLYCIFQAKEFINLNTSLNFVVVVLQKALNQIHLQEVIRKTPLCPTQKCVNENTHTHTITHTDALYILQL